MTIRFWVDTMRLATGSFLDDSEKSWNKRDLFVTSSDYFKSRGCHFSNDSESFENDKVKYFVFFCCFLQKFFLQFAVNE